jgi:hypothetical protein
MTCGVGAIISPLLGFSDLTRVPIWWIGALQGWPSRIMYSYERDRGKQTGSLGQHFPGSQGQQQHFNWAFWGSSNKTCMHLALTLLTNNLSDFGRQASCVCRPFGQSYPVRAWWRWINSKTTLRLYLHCTGGSVEGCQEVVGAFAVTKICGHRGD